MNRRANSTCKAKREAILLATADLMSRLGPDVSVTSIARSAAVSKQTVYNHFGSSEVAPVLRTVWRLG